MPYERELDALLRWLDATDAIALEHFSPATAVETKADGTPVTAADRGIEQTLRRAIEDEFPGDGVAGEEYGTTGAGERRWIIDPIDGTKNYARGIPIFGTLVALEEQGRVVLGAVSAPALASRWWATRGGGAYRDGAPIRVSTRASFADAEISTGSLVYAGADAARVLRVCERAKRWRAFGDFWGHMLVAQGSLDMMLELAPLALWDVAACVVIVEEAGGTAVDLDGASHPGVGPLVTSNGLVHDEALALLRARA